MIRAWRGRDSEISAEKSGSQLCDQLLHRIGLIAEAITEGAVATVRRGCPVGQFMQQGGVVGLLRRAGAGSDEVGRARDLDAVGRRPIVGPVASMGDDGSRRCHEGLHGRDAFDLRAIAHGLYRQAIDLFGGKDRRRPGEQPGFRIGPVVLGELQFLVEDDVGGFLALAHLRAGAVRITAPG